MKAAEWLLLGLWLVVAAVLALAALAQFGLDPNAGPALWLGIAGKLLMALAAAAAVSAAAGRLRDRAWWLLATGFWLYAGGQLYLGFRQIFSSDQQMVFPSPADVLFLLGNALFVLALFSFLDGLARAGLPLDFERRLPQVIGGVLLLGVIAALLVAPLFRGDAFDSQALLSLVYPFTDLVLMVPVILLSAATWPFRGGDAWSTWASLLAGFAGFFVGDLFFAVFLGRQDYWIGWLVDVAYLGAYALVAAAGWRQWQMTRGR